MYRLPQAPKFSNFFIEHMIFCLCEVFTSVWTGFLRVADVGECVLITSTRPHIYVLNGKKVAFQSCFVIGVNEQLQYHLIMH